MKYPYFRYLALLLVVFCSITMELDAQVQFNIRGIPGTNIYKVSMRPTENWDFPYNQTNSAQISIRAPHGLGPDKFTVSNLVSLVNDPVSGVPITWGINGSAASPIENPAFDYYDIGMWSAGLSLPYSVNQEVELFQFQNLGNCISDGGLGLIVEVIDNDTDPFSVIVIGGPNSAGLNTANEISPFGALIVGTPNAFTGIYADGNSDCSVNFPVEWLFFDATPVGSVVELEWGTLNELNNEWFVVERSVDNQFFEEIIKIPGAGTSYTTQAYKETDHHPVPGLSYYRLKQIDNDGGFTYSEVVEVFFDPESVNLGLQIFPNPISAGSEVMVKFDARVDEYFQLELYQVNGKVVYSQNIIALKGQNEIKLSTEDLSSGLYQVRLFNEEQTASRKLVVY